MARRPKGDRAQRYDAFVAYRHRSDAAAAVALRAALHRFDRPWHRFRACRVVLDDGTLAARTRLWEPITDILDRSGHLVLLACPASARSPWVAQEVEHFLAHHPDDRLIIALTGGRVRWDHLAGDVDRARTTALPPALQGRLRRPHWVDLTGARTAAAGGR